jgi:hypothetical protein
LIPLNSERDIDFSQPKLKFSAEEFAATAKLIGEAL